MARPVIWLIHIGVPGTMAFASHADVALTSGIRRLRFSFFSGMHTRAGLLQLMAAGIGWLLLRLLVVWGL
jgi:hypothetical protein